MQVILRADVPEVGKKGDIIEVSDGYGRNYLLPKGLALRATPGAQQQAASMRRARDVRDARDRGAAEEVAKLLVPRTIVIKARAGAEGRLFGSVTAIDVAEAVRAQTGVELDRRKLHFEEPVKSIGVHTVGAKLHPEVEFPVTIEVVTG